MTITLLIDGHERTTESARADGDELWIPAGELEPLTGWHLEPEGLCRDERCVPLPPGASLAGDDAVDFAGVARHLGRPVVVSSDGSAWAIGAEPPPAFAMPVRPAPDFSLPDRSGKERSLREWRGRKVILVAWASW